MRNEYSLFKGKLKYGVPYLDGYNGNPHYAIVLENTEGGLFAIVTNVKSDSSLSGTAGYHVLYYWDQYFSHPMLNDLSKLTLGLHQDNFPTLDYVHDAKLVELGRMRPIALDTATEKSDINDLLNKMLKLDTGKDPVDYEYNGKSGTEMRKAWAPSVDIIVYGFGFLFEPNKDGLHETHMNQGNPKVKRGSKVKDHSSENGINQDGAVLVDVAGKFQALFTAFQTQLVPTDNRGYPVPNAKPILG
jgi:uncharacterized protein YukJ